MKKAVLYSLGRIQVRIRTRSVVIRLDLAIPVALVAYGLVLWLTP